MVRRPEARFDADVVILLTSSGSPRSSKSLVFSPVAFGGLPKYPLMIARPGRLGDQDYPRVRGAAPKRETNPSAPGGSVTELMPHRHHEDRVYTVVSGVFYVGSSFILNRAEAQAGPGGSRVKP